MPQKQKLQRRIGCLQDVFLLEVLGFHDLDLDVFLFFSLDSVGVLFGVVCFFLHGFLLSLPAESGDGTVLVPLKKRGGSQSTTCGSHSSSLMISQFNRTANP